MTIYDIARMAGVSSATVSRVLNNGPVRPATEERLEGYRNALTERGLLINTDNIICEGAEKICEVLIDRIEGKRIGEPEEILFKPEIVIRESA